MKQTVRNLSYIVSQRPNWFVITLIVLLASTVLYFAYLNKPANSDFFYQISLGIFIALCASFLSLVAVALKDYLAKKPETVLSVSVSKRSAILSGQLKKTWNIQHSGHWATYIRDHCFADWAEKSTLENKNFSGTIVMISPADKSSIDAFVEYRNSTYRSNGAKLPHHILVGYKKTANSKFQEPELKANFVRAQLCATFASAEILNVSNPNFQIDFFIRPWFHVLRTEVLDNTIILSQDPKDVEPILLRRNTAISKDLERGIKIEIGLANQLQFDPHRITTAGNLDRYVSAVFTALTKVSPNTEEISFMKNAVAPFWKR